MDYLLSRENDAHESAKMRVARSVAIVDISLIYYFIWFTRGNISFRYHDESLIAQPNC